MGLFPRVFLPGPLDVWNAFISLTYKGILPEYLQDSMLRLAVGAFWGITLGIPLGLLIGMSRRAHTALWPLLLFFQAIGDVAWLPILVIWFGYGLVAMTFVIVYTVIFPVVLNTVLGVRSIHVNMHRAALSLGASKARVLWEVVLPGALPNIVTGLRNGLGYGWRALIAAERGSAPARQFEIAVVNIKAASIAVRRDRLGRDHALGLGVPARKPA
jgi:NitT/TauT family transport system permease protein/taurine transport system permease protein